VAPVYPLSFVAPVVSPVVRGSSSICRSWLRSPPISPVGQSLVAPVSVVACGSSIISVVSSCGSSICRSWLRYLLLLVAPAVSVTRSCGCRSWLQYLSSRPPVAPVSPVVHDSSNCCLWLRYLLSLVAVTPVAPVWVIHGSSLLYV